MRSVGLTLVPQNNRSNDVLHAGGACMATIYMTEQQILIVSMPWRHLSNSKLGNYYAIILFYSAGVVFDPVSGDGGLMYSN